MEFTATPLHETQSMQAYQVPTPVREVVQEHYESQDQIGLQSTGPSLAEKLQALESGTSVSQNTLEPIVFPEIEINDRSSEELPQVDISEASEVTSDVIQVADTLPRIIASEVSSPEVEESIALQSLDTPLMEYRDDIQEHPLEFALYGFQELQDEDGLIDGSVLLTYEFLRYLKYIG
ncbi:hypothetical protein MK079_04605, partial [Candidatus Gracilibacteria bacterium]|nr:hypothetical protein [Candidatus Gracilibacteria bacterium]